MAEAAQSTLNDLVSRALERDKWSVARLISIFEDTRQSAPAQRAEVLDLLRAGKGDQVGFFHGITGTPGAGKSSLLGEVALRLIQSDASSAVAVLAIDPASEISGGALLGDRTRVRFPVHDRRFFFRSQSSDRNLGGVSRTTYQVCRLLGHLFDHVFIETVGIGQSEIEIQYVADRIYLVLQPMGGDQIQFMKAGIMEVPDVFILNKSDEEVAARKSYHTLKASLTFSRPGEDALPILRTSATTGLGLDELVRVIADVKTDGRRHSPQEKEAYFFARWVRDEFGRRGVERLLEIGKAALPGQAARNYMDLTGGFDAGQMAFAAGNATP